MYHACWCFGYVCLQKTMQCEPCANIKSYSSILLKLESAGDGVWLQSRHLEFWHHRYRTGHRNCPLPQVPTHEGQSSVFLVLCLILTSRTLHCLCSSHGPRWFSTVAQKQAAVGLDGLLLLLKNKLLCFFIMGGLGCFIKCTFPVLGQTQPPQFTQVLRWSENISIVVLRFVSKLFIYYLLSLFFGRRLWEKKLIVVPPPERLVKSAHIWPDLYLEQRSAHKKEVA